MLTDIFAIRYEQTPLVKTFGRRESRLLLQLFTILEEIEPYRDKENKVRDEAKAFWEIVHKRVSNELGVKWLSYPWYEVNVGLGEYRRTETRRRDDTYVCQNWMTAQPKEGENVDEFLKERLSLFEVGMREKYNEVEKYKARIAADAQMERYYIKALQAAETSHTAGAEEVNARFKSSMLPLHYHNGFIQLQRDDLISSEIEQPFWSVVSDPLWENVDTDMKEAIDQRDSGGKDPAFYAGKALESTIKIISALLQQTHGSEKGAHNFIDNIAKRSVKFLDDWEAETLKHYFTKVRNPLGHGPGLEPMPVLPFEQSSLAIEVAMSWIKLLVDRAREKNIVGSSQ
jgi:hypothetical protein